MHLKCLMLKNDRNAYANQYIISDLTAGWVYEINPALFIRAWNYSYTSDIFQPF